MVKWAMAGGAAPNFGLNEQTGGLGRWLIWFRAIHGRYERYYSAEVRARNGLGDVIVGWRRGTTNTSLWVPSVTMLILGDTPPRAEDWNAAGVAHRAGDEHPLWMSYIHAHGWAVVAEGSRGIFRPNGVLVRWNPELAATLRRQEGG